jgi:hypothetical protein
MNDESYVHKTILKIMRYKATLRDIVDAEMAGCPKDHVP